MLPVVFRAQACFPQQVFELGEAMNHNEQRFLSSRSHRFPSHQQVTSASKVPSLPAQFLRSLVPFSSLIPTGANLLTFREQLTKSVVPLQRAQLQATTRYRARVIFLLSYRSRARFLQRAALPFTSDKPISFSLFNELVPSGKTEYERLGGSFPCTTLGLESF